jgi:hypothetical protein
VLASEREIKLRDAGAAAARSPPPWTGLSGGVNTSLTDLPTGMAGTLMSALSSASHVMPYMKRSVQAAAFALPF